MSLTTREIWVLVHGMILGAPFLLVFADTVVGLYSLWPELVTVAGIRQVIRRLKISTLLMAVIAWLTVLSGTYIICPWYYATPPQGADLTLYPRSFLEANPSLAAWHSFGMEWKEHIAWFAPILVTVAAYIVWRYGSQISQNPHLRTILLTLSALVFVTAGVAGLFGTLITKVAPLH